MQFYVISPLLIITVHKSRVIGSSVIMLLILCSCLVTLIISAVENALPSSDVSSEFSLNFSNHPFSISAQLYRCCTKVAPNEVVFIIKLMCTFLHCFLRYRTKRLTTPKFVIIRFIKSFSFSETTRKAWLGRHYWRFTEFLL